MLQHTRSACSEINPCLSLMTKVTELLHSEASLPGSEYAEYAGFSVGMLLLEQSLLSVLCTVSVMINLSVFLHLEK